MHGLPGLPHPCAPPFPTTQLACSISMMSLDTVRVKSTSGWHITSSRFTPAYEWVGGWGARLWVQVQG